MVVFLIVSVLTVVGKPALGGVVQAFAAGGADSVATTGVFIIGGDLADARMQPDGVVLDLDLVQLGA